MEKFLLSLALFLPLVMAEVEAIRVSYQQEASNLKLFVFGDSYVDTGNTPKLFAESWRKPYGISYPGKPTGRFSDGCILTDYIAEFFNTTSPVPYEKRKCRVFKLTKRGMNFAYGGTGVFSTRIPLPNMTIQINYFENLIQQKKYTRNDLESSIALISLAGNDYATYLRKKGSKKGTIKGLPCFVWKLIEQLDLNLKRIHELGVKKIGIVAMEPLGCLPRFTAPSFQRCNRNLDMAAKTHNLRLKRAVQKLRNENKGSVFVILDLYGAFTSALDKSGKSLRPCCVGVGKGNTCSSVDDRGEKKYTLCKDPNATFFWDEIHPSQHGWTSVYSLLQSPLHKLL